MFWAFWVWVSIVVQIKVIFLFFAVLGWVWAAFMECCWAGQWPEPAWSALVLLDLCDRLLKLTDSPALQAAIHQPLNLLQPWEHRHIFGCVSMWSRNRACCWMIRPVDLVTLSFPRQITPSLSAGIKRGRSNLSNRNLFSPDDGWWSSVQSYSQQTQTSGQTHSHGHTAQSCESEANSL